ncbi:KRAB [Mytilus coruscus]|uniref:KRAB n=1 Tax=Mytilus coruscus TaxID=42192 RepID=A0A6J8A468_MYTCO|nr:KRAB [Mytilus coruscus]
MESVTKGVRPSKLDACIENITRTLTQKSQEDDPHQPSNQSNFYKTEPYQATSESDTSLKMKIRKVGPFQTPDELKPYECPICHKKISNQANLRTHIRTHTEIEETTDFRMRVPKKENGSVLNSQRDVHMRDLESNTSQMDILKKEIYALNNSQIENLKKEIGSAIRDLPMEPPRPKHQAIDYSQSGRGGSLSPDRGGETKTNEALKLNMFSKLEMKRKESSTTQKLSHTQDNKVTYNCGLCSVAFPNTDSYFSHMMAHARDQSYNQRGPEFLDDQLLPWRKMKKQLKQDHDQNVFSSAEQEMLAAYDRELRAYKEQQRRADEKLNRFHMEKQTTSATEEDVMDDDESSMTSVVDEQKRHSADDPQPSGSNMNGNLSDSSSKLPHQQQPQGENQEMFIVIE